MAVTSQNTRPSLLDQWRAKSVAQFIPLQASLELTHRCNERCGHCYIENFADDRQRLLDEKGWQTVLDQLRQAGTLYIILMGGEPLLSPVFFPVLQRSSQMGFHTSMISNGLKITNPTLAQRLADDGLKTATFSLYSLDAATHDAMTRVKGSHQKLLQAITFCQRAGIQVTANCLLSHINIEGVFDLQEWCLDQGIELKVDPMITPKLNGDLAPTSLRASREQLLWFYRERTRRWRRSLPEITPEPANGYVCNAAKGKCAVTPYGELLPCIEVREPLGSLLTQEWDEIWYTSTAKKWREIRNSELVGSQKKLGSLCDHCPGMAQNESGDRLQVSSFALELAAIKVQVRQEVLGDGPHPAL